MSAARRIARDWVCGRAGPDLVGAFLAGSAAVGDGGRQLPTTSDVDLILVTAGPAPTKIGKLWHRGVLLDVSSLAIDNLDVATVAGTSYLAPFFTDGMILHDPAGRLAVLQRQVAAVADRPEWVRRRVAEVRTKVTTGLDALTAGADPEASLARQVIGWVFPASLPTVMLLVAARRPPTVRRRYLRCRELLTADGVPCLAGGLRGSHRSPLELYEDLLGVLGCREVAATQVRHHLDALADTLRVTARHAETSFPFSSDLRPDTWHLTLDGSAELVRDGWHREAVWWLLAGYARCLLVLAADAPGLVADHEPRLAAAAADLIDFRAGDGAGRAADVRALLGPVDAWAEAWIAS